MLESKTDFPPFPPGIIPVQTPVVSHWGFETGLSNTPPGKPIKKPDVSALKLIFLDIDGVINSKKTYVLHGKYPFPNDTRLDGEKYVLNVDFFDPLAIKLVNRLCENTGAHIVLSSTWRNEFDFMDIWPMLDEIGIDSQYLIGRTGISLRSKRGEEIAEFLEELQQGKKGTESLITSQLLHPQFKGEEMKLLSYVILDDLPENNFLPEQMDTFVNTLEDEGLSLMDTIVAGRILNDDNNFSFRHLLGNVNVGNSWN